MEYIVEDIKQYQGIAKDIIKAFPDKRIFQLKGDLGAGKTEFVKAFCKILGVTDEVSSPTFSIIQEYHDRNGQEIFHMDLYRINNEDELINIGLEEYFDRGNYIFIEWPQIMNEIYDIEFCTIELENLDGTKRRFIVNC
jgi:tRNA threonylcarbamoyladenosine biosynthesis protein TsaE